MRYRKSRALLVLDGSDGTAVARCPRTHVGDPTFTRFSKVAIFSGPRRLASLTMSAPSRFSALVSTGQRPITEGMTGEQAPQARQDRHRRPV
jgi:hypothetical protein